jgi:hypothetical protein
MGFQVQQGARQPALAPYFVLRERGLANIDESGCFAVDFGRSSYPWLMAMASLKPHRRRVVDVARVLLSMADGHGLIEARSISAASCDRVFVIHG